MKLVLASTSRYRQTLLNTLRLPFITDNPGISEAALAGEHPEQTAERLAIEKAQAVASRHPDCLIIGSDQVVSLDGRPLGKPGNHTNACQQLAQMQGRHVTFFTGLCLHNSRTQHSQHRVVKTIVHFRALSPEQIEYYLRAEQPYDCAGSAKSEGFGISLIQNIEGSDPNALVGLPLIALIDFLIAESVDILNDRSI